MSYQDYKNSHMSVGVDVDGWYGYQCWDGYADYCQYLGVPYANCTASGYAKDIWEQRQSNGMLDNFDEVEVMQPGDIAIFKVHPATPVSHVAIFDSDAGNGYGNFFGQNQGAPDGVYNIVQLPYDATYPTAFRRKGLTQTSAQRTNKYFLDVSAYQPGDLSGICEQAGTRDTIIKVTEGSGWVSPVASQQVQTSNAIGYYHFARFGGSVAQADAEASHFLSNLPYPNVKYLVCDYEDDASADRNANTEAVLHFMQRCKDAGYKPLYYSYKPYTLANVDAERITATFGACLWIAAYPNYDITPEPYWPLNPNMSGQVAWQFTSTAIAGGLDKSIFLTDDTDIINTTTEDTNMTDFVARNHTGDSGYVAVVNDRVFGIGDMDTVLQLQAAGAKHLNLNDADFGRFIDSRASSSDVAKALKDASADVVKQIEDLKATGVNAPQQ